jgi:hypothetical protein
MKRKNIKSLIVALCLALALSVSGTYATKVHADESSGNPQGTKSTPPSASAAEGSPEHCLLCYVKWMLGF